jgi:hypothetical protein
MDVEWTVGSGRLHRTGHAAYLREVDALLAAQSGHSDVWRADSTYPVLTISISEQHAVVHWFPEEGVCYLLDGDESVAADENRDFLVQEVTTAFTGDFISSGSRAAGVVTQFVGGADPAELGNWSRL